MSTFNLRNQNDTLPETFNLGSRGLHDAYRTMPMAGAGEVRRGWESSGLGLRVNELLGASNLAETQGDTMRAATLRQQAEDLQAQASAWAPRVQNMTDISSFGDAVDWAGGQLGNIRSSVAPMVGGVVGAGLGGAVGLLARNPGLGARIGGYLGAGSQSIPMMRDESIAEAMMDPEIAATRTAQEIRNTGNVVGVAGGMLDALVPGTIAGGLATAGRKALANELAERGAARVVGGAVAKEAGEEFLTEGAQSLVGQAGQNYLRRDDLTDFDYKEALNAAAGGAIGGGVMGGAGKVIEVGGNKLFSGTQAVADKTREIAANPMQKVGDFVADTGAKIGEMVGKRDGAMSDEQMQRSAEKIAERLSQPDVSDADRASALEMIRSGKFMEDDNPFTLTQDDGDVTTDQGKLQADRNVAARAAAHADKILDPDYRRDFSEDERIAAARYKAGQTDYNQFRTELEAAKAAKRAKKIADEDFPDVKYSRMTSRGELSQRLADLWLKKEGQNRKLFTEAGEDGRKLATKVMEWVRSGFGAEYDEDGNHFIPTKLVEELGDDAAKVVAEMARIANAQGVMYKSDKLLDVIDEVKQLAMNKVGDNTFVRSMLTPLAADSMTEAKQKVLVGLLRSTKGKPSKAVRAGLEEMFGPNTDKVLAHFTEAASKGRYGAPQKNGRTGSADNRVVVGVDENGELVLAEELVETGADGRPTEYDGPQLIGMGDENRAFDAPVQDGKKLDTPGRRAMERLLQQMGEDRSVRVREVGAWSDIKNNLRGPENEALRREAENELISNYLPEWMDEFGAITTGKPVPSDLNELTTQERKKLLNRIDARFRFIIREPNNALSDPGKLPSSGRGSIASLKYKIPKAARMAGVTEADLTARDGFVFLERKIGDRISAFPVQTSQLLSNKTGAWEATSETPVVEGQLGAAGISKQALSMLTNIIYSDNSFTGRIGFRKEAGGELQWLKQGSHGLVVDNETGVSKAALTRTHVTDDQGNRVMVADAGPDNLPGETKLGKSGTVADAREQENFERRSEKTKGIAYAETHAERVQALKDEVRKAVEGKRWYVGPFTIDFLTKALKANRENEILSIYYTIRNQADGKIDDFGGTPTLTVRIIDAQRGYRPTNEIDVDLDKLRDARNKFNGATDNQLVDHSTSDDRVPSEGHDEIQTGIRREDPPAPEGDGETYRAVLTKPLPGALAHRLSEHDRLLRKAGVTKAQLDEAGGADWYDGVIRAKAKKLAELRAELKGVKKGEAVRPELVKKIEEVSAQLEVAKANERKRFDGVTKAVARRLNDEDRQKFMALRAVRESDQRREREWYLKHMAPASDVEGSIQRNDDGAIQGFGTDAEGSGYGGNSRGGSRGQAPHSEPVNTSSKDAERRMHKALKALDRMETARDWAVVTLKEKGVQGIFDAVETISSPKSVAQFGIEATVQRLDTLKFAVLGLDVKRTVRGAVTKTKPDARGRPVRVPGEFEWGPDRTVIDHYPGLIDLSALGIHNLSRSLGEQMSLRRGHEIRAQLKENATVLRELFDNTRRRVKDGATSAHGGSAQVRPTDTRGQADARGAEARVAEGNQRQRADGESGLWTSGQGQQPDAAGRGVAEQLQAYLDQHGNKNAVWANASRKALASGDQKQVAGALAAARKQFGELSTPSETRVGADATTKVPAPPESGPGSMQQPHSLPMSYKIYNSEDIRPELRSKYKPGDGIAAMIPNGDRTATTRNPPAGVKVGHIIKFPGVEGLYRVTGFEKIDLSTPAGREKWSKREGWDVSMTGSFGSQVRTGATQMLFERVDSASTLASTGADAGAKKEGTFEKPIVGDIWEQGGYVVVSTNLGGVHGRGLAKQAKDKGLITQRNKDFDSSPKGQKVLLVAVKGHEPSTAKVKGSAFSEQVVGKNVDLLKAEIAKVVEFAKAHPNEKIYLPYVGLGFGEGSVADIGPILAEAASVPNIFMVAKDEATVQKYAESFKPGVRRDATTTDSNTKFSRMGNNQAQTETSATPEQVKAAEAFLTKALGDSIHTLLAENLDPDVSGFWKQRDTKNLIVLSLKGDVLGTAYHEAAHELFSILTKHGSEKTKAQLLRVATNPIILKKLEHLLEQHPEAIKQLSDPEEALAYMFQFSQMGMLKIGPETKTLFQKIKALLRKVAALVSDRIRAENIERARTDKELLKADAVLQAFAGGSMADPVARQAFLQSLEADTAKHDAAVEAIGDGWTKLANTAGKFVFSAEAMMEATNNEEMVALSRLFHQKAGTEMKNSPANEAENAYGAYFAGVRGETNKWMNRLENVLLKYSPEDLELARKALSTGKPTYAPEAAKAVAEIKAFYDKMYEYMEKSDVRRLSERNGEHVWEKVPRREDYGITQVWDVDIIMKDTEAFKQDLLKHHSRELQKIADQANAEIKAGKGAGAGTASDTQLKSAQPSTVTPEMVADAILVRMINSGGQIDLEETTSNLGMTPVATAVNRRSLDWLDAEVFDKYKSKDIAHIMTTYTRNMVKRAEYQKRFGYGGEKIRDLSDRAILRELGGKKLIAQAIDALPQAIEQWKKAKAVFLKNNPGAEFPDPYPTLRLVGQRLHMSKVGNDQFQKDLLAATRKLEQAFKAIQAMEGTLGNDMNPTWRAMSSWLITYQNFRLLSTMLFTSFSDVMGIVVNGGEMKDAWDAFVNGMREIRNTYVNKKGPTAGSIRAEEWGAVDAGSLLDSLGQTYGSVYMTAKAKRMSDAFFKYTGAEGWNRGIRIVAANTAERIITGWRKNGIDLSDPAKKAQFERLFGKDAVPADIKLDSEGRLDINDPANQAAVQRWVLDAVMAPNAANRPIWGSDPHFQTFMHLKNYAYTFHRVMLRGVVEQARLGNFRPAMVLAVGYMPIMIAAGAVKEMLVPGEEPPWMQGGLDDYLQYGWDRAGLLGVPQMYGSALMDGDPAALFGPTVDQIQNILSIPLLDHRTLLGESLGSLPGGNLLRRAGQE